MTSDERETTYTHGHEDAVLASHRWRTVENSAGHVLPFLVSGTSVLDVGCGPGTITMDMAERVAPGRVVGFDASSDVLAAARMAANDAGHHRIDWIEGDVPYSAA